MKNWLFFLTHAIEATIILVAVYFEPTFCVRGVLRGEEFYQGRPSSYWAAELERWDINPIRIFFFGGNPNDMRSVSCFSREPSWFEQLQRRLCGSPDRSIIDLNSRPVVFEDDPNARAVLEELLRHSSPKVAQLAAIGLGRDPEYRDGRIYETEDYPKPFTAP